MTPVQIIALARIQYGETDPNTVTANAARDFLNSAVKELYEDLPPSRLKNLLTQAAVVLTSGRGDVLTTWDKVVDLYVDNTPAIQVSREAIFQHDYSQYFSSPVPIFHVDDKYIWVRPTASTCHITFLAPPAAITAGNEGVEFTGLDAVFHPALADLTTSFMYSQEEDVQQAELYRNAYQQKLGMLLAQEPAA